jgi:hypothetical protein
VNLWTKIIGRTSLSKYPVEKAEVERQTALTLLHLAETQVGMDRILALADGRFELENPNERFRSDMTVVHEGETEDLLENRASALPDAEDKQVQTEADMREQQVQDGYIGLGIKFTT